jgi:hypothetical protein
MDLCDILAVYIFQSRPDDSFYNGSWMKQLHWLRKYYSNWAKRKERLYFRKYGISMEEAIKEYGRWVHIGS